MMICCCTESCGFNLIRIGVFGVCQRDYAKNTVHPIFTKFGGKAARGPRKTRLDFGGNADRVTVGSGLGWGLGHGFGRSVILCRIKSNPATSVSRGMSQPHLCFTRRLLNPLVHSVLLKGRYKKLDVRNRHSIFK